MGPFEDQANFYGNTKHYKVLLKALQAGDVRLWNRFARSMGPGFQADLRGIQLRGATLREINFKHARLEEADLRESDLSWADLRGAKLSQTQFAEAIICHTKFPCPPNDGSLSPPTSAKASPERQHEAKFSPKIQRKNGDWHRLKKQPLFKIE